MALDFARTQPALLRLGVGAQRHLGAPVAYRTIACLPALVGAWRHRGGGCSYIPTATASAIPSAVLDGAELRPGEVRRINMSQLGAALTDPELEPPVKALVVWSSNPAQIAPDQELVLAGLRREDLFTLVIEQFMTDTARHADVILPATTQLEHLDAVFSWGHQYFTLNEPAIEPLGEAKPTTEAFRLLAARLGSTTRRSRETDEQLLERLLEGDPGGVSLGEPARARLAEDRPRPGARAARRGQLRHPHGQARAARRLARRRGGRHAAVLRPAGGGGRRGARRRCRSRWSPRRPTCS